MNQGQYPLNGRTLAPADTVTGVVASSTADIPLSVLAQFVLSSSGSISGPTINRPVPGFIGQGYFDTSLNQPIWASALNPPLWVNAAGVAV